MYPNSQDALPLPERPDIERYRKLAKELVKACRIATKPDDGAWADRWFRKWVEGIVRLSGMVITPHLPVRVESWIGGLAEFARRQMRGANGRSCALADAQFVIARSHGFQSWPKFVTHLEALESADSQDTRFEMAVNAIVAGDVVTLGRLLAEEPGLVQAQSGREHGASLLHYVAANGVEGYRQRTPANVVEIARMLIEAGTDVDAKAQVYGAECTTLTLAATSGHPERVGVQLALLALLLERGAVLEASLVEACLASGRQQAAEFLAQRLENAGRAVGFTCAAGLGRREWLEQSFAPAEGGNPAVAAGELQKGFWFACQFGRDEVAEFLLGHGAGIDVADARGQTGLHHAVIGGHASTVRLLLKHQPSLEAVNVYGGTPLGQALWSAAHGGETKSYLEILEALVAAGSALPERHVPVTSGIDSWLEQRGSGAEPEWHWFGEGPGGRQ